MRGNRQTRILVADDDVRVRSAMQLLLRQEPRLIVGECSDFDSLLIQLEEFRPDLVFLDWELRGRPATAVLFPVRVPDFRPKTIVLSGRPESEQAALAAGADAFVSKADPPEQLLSTFRRLVRESGKGVTP